MGVEFKNADVAAKYESLRSADGKVHVPAGKKKGPGDNPVGYSGPLSEITLAAADKTFAQNSNLLKLKEHVKTAGASANNKIGAGNKVES